MITLVRVVCDCVYVVKEHTFHLDQTLTQINTGTHAHSFSPQQHALTQTYENHTHQHTTTNANITHTNIVESSHILLDDHMHEFTHLLSSLLCKKLRAETLSCFLHLSIELPRPLVLFLGRQGLLFFSVDILVRHFAFLCVHESRWIRIDNVAPSQVAECSPNRLAVRRRNRRHIGDLPSTQAPASPCNLAEELKGTSNENVRHGT